MRKDYIYQDKGQYKLMQNATRIGDFYAGDQGIVPSERVLPEQKFAHQPIFRRPPEELVATTYYLQYRDFVIATEDTEKKLNGDPLSPVLKVKGLVSHREPTPEAMALADKFVQGDVWDNPGYFTEAELIILTTYYLNGIGAVVSPNWPIPAQPNPSVYSFRLFKKYGFYVHQVDMIGSWITSVWSGSLSGRFALEGVHEVIPYQGNWIQKIHFLYQDGDTFGMVVGKGTGGWYYVYTANNIEGPWAETGFIDATPNNPGGDVALVTYLKDCKRLLRQFGVLGSNPTLSIPGVTVGKTGEWVGLWAVTLSFNDLKPKYVCRMTKKSGGIELERVAVKLKFRNGQIRSFSSTGAGNDW